MKIKNFLSITVLICILNSCMNLRKDQERHKDFMEQSDCIIYKNEVIVEKYDFGRVAFIDTSKGSGCANTQLKNVYLLYYDSNYVVVYKQHPKQNIKIIKSFIKNYQTDSTRLASFVKFDSSLRITVSRFCKDTTNEFYFGKFVNWRQIEFDGSLNKFIQTKANLINTWYKWE